MARKDCDQWVEEAHVLTFLEPIKTPNSMPPGEQGGEKRAMKSLHFGGREHKISDHVVLQHGKDEVTGYKARRYQLVEKKGTAASLSTLFTSSVAAKEAWTASPLPPPHPLIDCNESAAVSAEADAPRRLNDQEALDMETIMSALEGHNAGKKRMLLQMAWDTICSEGSMHNPHKREKYRSWRSKLCMVAVGAHLFEDGDEDGSAESPDEGDSSDGHSTDGYSTDGCSTDSGDESCSHERLSIEELIDKGLEMVIQSWSEPRSQSVAEIEHIHEEIERIEEEEKRANVRKESSATQAPSAALYGEVSGTLCGDESSQKTNVEIDGETKFAEQKHLRAAKGTEQKLKEAGKLLRKLFGGTRKEKKNKYRQ